MTDQETRRARAEIYRVTLEYLHHLTSRATNCRLERIDEPGRLRRVGSQLTCLEADLARLGSPRVGYLVGEISRCLLEGRPHERSHVVEVALIMAAEVDAPLSADFQVGPSPA